MKVTCDIIDLVNAEVQLPAKSAGYLGMKIDQLIQEEVNKALREHVAIKMHEEAAALREKALERLYPGELLSAAGRIDREVLRLINPPEPGLFRLLWRAIFG